MTFNGDRKMNRLAELNNVLNQPGEAMDLGCEALQHEEMIQQCREINPNKAVCVVSHWMWWDIPLEATKGNGSPSVSMIKADNIIFDELDWFPPSGWVRSSPLCKLHDNCIFETGNTFYILVGPGTRKKVSSGDVMALF